MTFRAGQRPFSVRLVLPGPSCIDLSWQVLGTLGGVVVEEVADFFASGCPGGRRRWIAARWADLRTAA